MHTIAAKFGAFALAPFFFFGNHPQPMHPPTPTPVYPSHQYAPIITGVDGPTALDVNQDGTWTVDVNSSSHANLHYSVKWGDEGSTARAAMTADRIDSSATFTHAYASAGTYYPEFTVTNDQGGSTTKTLTVAVGVDVAPYIDSVTPDHGPLGTEAAVSGTGFNASSTITVGGIAATNVMMHNNGTISFSVPSLANGTYNVRVHNGDTRSNPVIFTVTAATPNISIAGVDAPVALYVGANGTWTVHTNTTSDSLHYSVTWGDEGATPFARMAQSESVQSSSTFTHAYGTAGTYYPKFTVSDDYGHSASVSTSVLVRAE